MTASTHPGWFTRLFAWLVGTDRAPLQRVVGASRQPAPVWPHADKAAVTALGAAIERVATAEIAQRKPVAEPPPAGSAPAQPIPRRTVVRPLARQLAVQARLNVRAGTKARPLASTGRHVATRSKPKPIRAVRVVAARRPSLRPRAAMPLRRFSTGNSLRPSAQIVRFPTTTARTARAKSALRLAA
jgi:hypothetical protein